jgi:peptidyl-prolyl cis-trans isomerase D
MMQAIRGRAGSIIVKVLFGLLIISFGFWGVSDYFFRDQGRPDTVVATVGDQSIRADELQQAMQQTLERMRAQFGGAIDLEQLKQLRYADTLLNQLIDRSLVNQEVQRLGLDVSDDAIRAAIYNDPSFRGPDGSFNRQLFAQVLMMNHMTEEQLVARLRHDIPRADLVQALTVGAAAPVPVVEALYRYREEKRIADIVSFPASAVTDVGEPDEAELTKFYEAHPDLFRAPEYRAFTLASLSPSDIAKQEAIPEEKLRSEYDERKDEFGKPEQRQIQQILAPSEEKAKEVEAELAAGKDWNEVAKSVGQNPDTIDLGLLNRKEIPHELGDVAFELPLNKPSEPVKTPFGWHVLRVVKIEPAATQSFEEVKPKIAAELQLRDAVDRLAQIGNQADDALAGGGKIAEVAAKFGFKVTTVPAADEEGKDPEGKAVELPVASADVVKTVFSTREGETSRVIDMDDGSIYIVQVDKVTPTHVRPLAEVKDKAVAAWQAEKKRETATKQAEALAAAVAPEAPLAKAAGDKGLTLLAAIPLSRTPQPGQPVPPAVVAKLFAAKQGEVVTGTDASGAYAAQLKQIETPEKVPEAEAKKIAQQLDNQIKVDIANQFTEALRRRFPVEIKRDELDRLF